MRPGRAGRQCVSRTTTTSPAGSVTVPAVGSATPLPAPISHVNCCTLVLDGRILVLGGESPDLRREVLQFDPAAGSWTVVGLLPDRRSTAVAGIIDGRLVMATGNSPGQTDDVWIGTLG